MKKPAAGRGTFQTNPQVERFTGLFAARMKLPWTMQRRRYSECIPSAISEILRLTNDYDVLRGHAGKWRSHPNGGSIGFQHQHSLTAQPEIGFANAAEVSTNAVSYNLQRRPLPGLGEMPIDRQFRVRIETHG
jgi:hypothetical protein